MLHLPRSESSTHIVELTGHFLWHSRGSIDEHRYGAKALFLSHCISKILACSERLFDMLHRAALQSLFSREWAQTLWLETDRQYDYVQQTIKLRIF